MSSLSPMLYVVEFRPVFSTPRISGYLRAINAFIQGTSEIALKAEERAERAFATFADIPYGDRHEQRELECLLNDMRG